MKNKQIIIAECIYDFQVGLDKCNRPEDRNLVSKYLSALALLLAKLTLEKNIDEEIVNIDRLFGNSWLIEIEPFNSAIDKWCDFKEYMKES